MTFDEQVRELAATLRRLFPNRAGDAADLALNLSVALTARKVDWEITIDGKSARLLDLPVGILRDVAEATKTRWRAFCDDPLENLHVAPLLLARTAQHLGCLPPPADLSARQLQSFFRAVDAGLPDDIDAPDPDPGRVDPTSSVTSTSG